MLDFADTETSPPKDGESGAQGGGPAVNSSDLNDNNESLNQARGSSLNLGGVDHAGKRQMHPSDLLNVKRIASVSQHEDGRILLGDMVNQICAERLQFQELTAARERANQLQLRDIQRKSRREAFVSMFRGVPCQLAAGAAHDLNNSNGDLLELLSRLCGVESQDYGPGEPWEQDIVDSVSLNAESVRSVVQLVRQNQATISELYSLLREGVRQGGGWPVVEAMMAKR